MILRKLSLILPLCCQWRMIRYSLFRQLFKYNFLVVNFKWSVNHTWGQLSLISNFSVINCKWSNKDSSSSVSYIVSSTVNSYFSQLSPMVDDQLMLLCQLSLILPLCCQSRKIRLLILQLSVVSISTWGSSMVKDPSVFMTRTPCSSLVLCNKWKNTDGAGNSRIGVVSLSYLCYENSVHLCKCV